MKTQRRRVLGCCAVVLALVANPRGGGLCIADDPFAAPRPLEWTAASVDGWVVYTASQRVPLRSSDAHVLAKEVFLPLVQRSRQSKNAFIAQFSRHTFSAENQFEVVGKIYRVLHDRSAQVDVLNMAHDPQTNIVAACLIPLPRKDLDDGERAVSYPVGAFHTAQKGWSYFVLGHSLQQQLRQMVDAADQNALCVDVKRFWHQADTLYKRMDQVGPQHARTDTQNTKGSPTGSESLNFATFSEAADHQLAQRLATLPGHSASPMCLADAQRAIRAAKIDRRVARACDVRFGQDEGGKRQLSSLTFDALWPALRRDHGEPVKVVALDDVGEGQNAMSAIGTLRQHLVGLRNGSHDAVLDSLEPGSWRERYRKSMESPISELLREKFYSGWTRMTVFFELTVQVEEALYSAIYYQVSTELQDTKSRTGRLDTIFLRRDGSGRWFITEDMYLSILGKTMRGELPNARRRTLSEIRDIVSTHSSRSEAYHKVIKPLLLSHK